MPQYLMMWPETLTLAYIVRAGVHLICDRGGAELNLGATICDGTQQMARISAADGQKAAIFVTHACTAPLVVFSRTPRSYC